LIDNADRTDQSRRYPKYAWTSSTIFFHRLLGVSLAHSTLSADHTPMTTISEKYWNSTPSFCCSQ